MLLNYQYRLYPETHQKLELNYWLRTCQYWYNWQLGDRFTWWQENRSDYIVLSGEFCTISCTVQPKELRNNPDFYSQKKLLPIIKQDLVKVGHSGELLDFTRVPSQTLQDVSKRVGKSFERFIKGDVKGFRSGRPRFKNSARFRTMLIEGQGVEIERVTRKWLFISIPKLKSWLKLRLHRPLPKGFDLKNVLLTKKADGWYATLALLDLTVPTFNKSEIVPTWENSVGLDAVLHEDDYLATSEGEKLSSLKSFRKSQAKLAKISQRKQARKKGSARRRQLAKHEARQHQRIARARSDFAYKTAHKVVRMGKQVIFREDLNLRALTKRNQAKKGEEGHYEKNGQSAKSGLNKSWLDAAFGDFFSTLEHIAVKAGARVIAVNPAYTSQLLSYRDEFIFTDTSIREYWDEKELIIVDRDINALCRLQRLQRRQRENYTLLTFSTTFQVDIELSSPKKVSTFHHLCRS